MMFSDGPMDESLRWHAEKPSRPQRADPTRAGALYAVASVQLALSVRRSDSWVSSDSNPSEGG